MNDEQQPSVSGCLFLAAGMVSIGILGSLITKELGYSENLGGYIGSFVVLIAWIWKRI